MKKIKYNEVSSGYSNSLIMFGKHVDGMIEIWDVIEHHKICNFNSVFEIGGKRLAISEDGEYCAVAAYDIYGVQLHDTRNGKLLWKRNDLKKAQRLTFSNYYNAVVACFSKKSCHLLSLDSGETIKTFRGIREYWESPLKKIALLVKANSFEIYYLDAEKSITKRKLNSFAMIEAVFIKDNIFILEADGVARYYDLEDLDMIWQYFPPQNFRVVAIGYRSDTADAVILERNRFSGSDLALTILDITSGKVKKKFLLNDFVYPGSFVSCGKYYVNIEGEIVNTEDGSINRLQ